MNGRKRGRKLISLILSLVMIVGMVPLSAAAAPATDSSTTKSNVSKVRSYSTQLRTANEKTDYSKGKFTWDTEGKSDSWRYFNGVMLDAFLMEGDTVYADAFYSGNINNDGTIKNYITGELDSVPTARGLFDLLSTSANAEKYKKAIQYVYTQLEGQTSYSECGGNYLHKQKSDGTPTSSWSTWNIGLDGLYMAQPFLMECANAIDEGTLTLTAEDGSEVTSAAIYEAVYNRFAWVASTMYDETTGLYHHGWNVSESKGNGHFWGRGIGWYAVALVDVIEMMPASYRSQMIPYLTKLFDGMLNYQDAETGMWYNVIIRGTDLSNNKLETSVSAMMAYSLMKAYNLGYVTDAKYGQAGLAAFNGVVANKMSGSEGNYTVSDVYQKSGVGESDDYYTRNSYTTDEAKGTGALIMAATVANATASKLPATEDPGTTVSDKVTDKKTGVSVSGSGATAIFVTDMNNDNTVKTALAGKLADGYAAYDIKLTDYTQGKEATVTMPAPEGANAVYYVPDNDSAVEEITGAIFDNGTVTFTATHFSTYAAGSKVATDGDGTTSGNGNVDKTKENWGLNAATKYPEYPADGAVRIDKTATGQDFNSTGVVKVELDTAGISVKQGVDVVLVVDVSNSMGWTDNWFENMTAEEVAAAKDNVKIPNGSAAATTDKLDQAMASAQEFASILLGDNTTGSSSNNSLSFVTFAGFDKDNTNESGDKIKYIDSVQTVFTNVQDASSANTAFANTKFTNYAVSGTSVNFTLQIGKTDGSIVSGQNRGNTNYDYAFAEGNAAVNALKNSYGGASAYAETGRETIVVFMTDGAPSHYNGNRLNGSHSDTLYGTKTTYAAVGAYNGNAADSAETWLTFIDEPNTYAETLNGNIDDFYAVGFDLAHGGFGDYSFSEGDLQPVLEGLAGDNTVDVELVSNGAALRAFYSSLAQKIKLAGTEAQVTDTIGRDFTLQMTTTTGTGDQHGTLSTAPTIEVTSYDLYTKATTTDSTLIGTRTGTSTTLETVTFNEDGTAAYSDQIGDGTTNIMSTENGVITITAKYFTYTKDESGEKFVWNIGDITDDEVALSYYAYLTGTMEGTREKGEVYYTNEVATLEYVDINGDYAKKDFPMPAVAWGGATTSFEYYLVNEKGEPVNRAGQVVPFANRIVLYGDSVALNLNQGITIPAQTIQASQYLPEGYFLYDVNAYYTVSTASDSSLNKGITVSEPSEDAKKTTGTAPNQVTQTGAQTTIVVSPQNPTADETYIQTRVAFGVRWDLTPSYAEYELVKDQIVLDYGKAIRVNVLANDTTIPTGYTGTLVGFTAYNANANLKQMQQSAGSATYTTDNGTYTIVDGKVNFKLNTMLSEVEKVFCVVQVTETADTTNYYYLYEELDIIPATNVYYETDFAEGVFTLDTTSGWDKTTVNGDIVADGPQNDGTIGQNLYGYDSSYTNDKYQSDGSSYLVTGAGSDKTTANFSFTGTGFDIISRTGNDEGTIVVKVYSDAAKTKIEKAVTVLNKSESNLTLYQIPVVSIEGLSYGTHYVEIGVSEPNKTTSIEALKNNGQFHFDAVRIYNPVNASASASDASDAGIAYAAYTADGEAEPSVTEVRNMLIAANIFDETADTEDPDYVEGVSFIDQTQEGAVLADYKTIGPNNEVYLTGDQTIGFKIQVGRTLPSSIDIGAKSANGEIVTLHAAILDSSFTTIDGAGTGDNGVNIESATAQYFNLMGTKSVSEVFDNSDYIYVLIDNRGDGVLSITDLKIAYGTETSTVQILSDQALVEAAEAYVNEKAAEEAVVDYDIISAQFTTSSVKRNKKATMIVKTSDAVESLSVANVAGRDMKASATVESESDGIKTWKVTFKVTSVGNNQKFTVTGYGADGTAGEPATAAVKVTAR